MKSASACPRLLGLTSLAGLVIAGTLAAEAPSEPTPAPKQLELYEKEVLPLLQAQCLKCHGEEKVRGGLRLTNREATLKGGDTGPAVTLGKPAESLLLKAIDYRGELRMPPKGRLPQKDIDLLARWVKEGLPWTPNKELAKVHETKGGKITAESRNYWAYRAVQRPETPAVRETSWIRNPIDRFILSRLETKGLAPAPPADAISLVRRVYYDLTGLPPTPDEIDAFIKDSSGMAYEELIDRLLASPRYGEKWGRHWLDLVRFAETNGYERDGPKPFAWRFRDYVISSFNTDKPFDQFLREQLAGDELPGYNPDAVIATGFYRLGLWDDEPVDPLQSRYDELDDIVATTGQVFLGMTMNCARCHDHKIDPIPQADYYRLLAFFQDLSPFSDTRDTSSRFNLTDITPPSKRALYEKELKDREAGIEALTRRATALEDEAIKKMPAEDQRAAEALDRPQVVRKVPEYLEEKQRVEYRKVRKELEGIKRRPTPSQELALSVNRCQVNPAITHVLIRGNAHSPGARVEPGFPEVLGFAPPTLAKLPDGAKTSGRRILLADWIASPQNPLTARVLVNRLWHHHFGRGIVSSLNDFGKFGTAPTHPELLDWLADDLAKGGWRLKRMHKLILTSNAYRMSSQASAAGLRIDPGNNLFWRFNARRLTAEEVRDSVLAVSGQLNLKMGGPSVYPVIPREVLAGQSVPGQGWGKSSPEEAARRSVYVYVKRSLLVPILSQHDQADTDSSCPVRYTTTVPTQALGLLNGDFTNEQAALLSHRLRQSAPRSLEAQVRLALRLTTGRSPGEAEVRKDLDFIQDMQASLGPDGALRQFCLLSLLTNEFLYLD